MRIVKAIIKIICDHNNNAWSEDDVRFNWFMTYFFAIQLISAITLAILATIYHW